MFPNLDFNATQHDPLHKILLEKRIHGQNQEFQCPTQVNSTSVARAGINNGK